MPYKFVANSFHTKKNFVGDFLQAKTEIGRFASLSPLLGDLKFFR